MERSIAGLSIPLPRQLPGTRELTGSARAWFALLLTRRRARIALLCTLIALPLLAGGWLWLRHSPLASVKHVRVSGLHGPQAHAIEAALVGAAQHMSTLDVNTGALRAAVAPFHLIREVHASASFPHSLRIEVVEQLPVAALLVGGTRTAVTAEGVVLGPALLSSSLPTVGDDILPAVGKHVSNQLVLASLTVLGAAPRPLARQVERVYSGSNGLTVAMHNGLLAYFGDATRPHAKWFSLARVLADSSSAGASYVDVRLPARPAAGFASGVAPALAATGTSEEATGAAASSSESTVDALAAGLHSDAGEEEKEPGSEAAATSESSSVASSETAPAEPIEGGATTSSE